MYGLMEPWATFLTTAEVTSLAAGVIACETCTGPVTSCCGCFTVRTGAYLLSLWSMLWGMLYIKVEKWQIPVMIQSLEKTREAYNDSCTGLIVKNEQQCDEILPSIERGDKTLEFWKSAVPMYRVIGACYVLFSLVGWRAGYTNSPLLAKLFMMVFPASFAIELSLAFISPEEESPLSILLYGLTLAYFFKVAWSFYMRLRLAEEANRILTIIDGPGSGGGEIGGELLGGGNATARTSSGTNSPTTGVQLSALSA